MEKILIGVVIGIFVGALTVEILNRKKPELTREIEKKAKDAVDAFAAAFKEGFKVENGETGSMRPEQSSA